MRTRVLSRACTHTGQILAMLSRDPEITRTSGRIEVSQLLKTLDNMVPREVQKTIYSPATRESNTDRNIAEEVRKTLRQLAELRFIEFISGKETIVLAESINRFVEMARYDNEIEDAKKEILRTTRGVLIGGVELNINDPDEDNGEN